MLIVLIGPSGSGKTVISNFLKGENIDFSISDKLKSKRDKYNFKKIITYTTRKKRFGERNFIDYIFLSNKIFQEYINENKFIEYSLVLDNYYGILKKSLLDNEGNRLLLLDPQGVQKLKEQNIQCYTIFLDIPNEVSKDRMTKRKDKNKSIEFRQQNSDYFQEYKHKCDIVINANKDVELILNDIFLFLDNIL